MNKKNSIFLLIAALPFLTLFTRATDSCVQYRRAQLILDVQSKKLRSLGEPQPIEKICSPLVTSGRENAQIQWMDSERNAVYGRRVRVSLAQPWDRVIAGKLQGGLTPETHVLIGVHLPARATAGRIRLIGDDKKLIGEGLL